MKKFTTRLLAVILACAVLTPSVAFAREIQLPDNMEIRNIIFMVPDGMDANAATLARWFLAFDAETEEVDLDVRLRMDELMSGMVRSYWTDGTVIGAIADSAPVGTTMATGHITNNRFIGVTYEVEPIANIMQAARSLGKSTGLIATSNIQHATPAAFSAHHIERNRYDIIGEQQVYGNFDVVFGAGLQFMMPPFRQDDENMLESLEARGYQFVQTRDEMFEITQGRVWGLFAPHFMTNEIDRPQVTPHQPSLAEMTDKAIELLSQNEEGFFLMVEGSKVDWAGHGNEPIAIISEILAFDEAVGVALDFAQQCSHTMIIIVSDHGTGGLTMGDRATSSTYHSDPIARFIAPLARATASFEGIFFRAMGNPDADVVELIYEHMGIDDLTDEEIEAIEETISNFVAFRDVMGAVISPRANIGWTTGGHVGNDSTLYTFLPGDQRLVGLFSQRDFATIFEAVWDFDFATLTDELFNDARPHFEERRATVTINSDVVSGGYMTVIRDYNILIVHENKDYVYFNDQRLYFDSVMVLAQDRFFVPQGVLDLLR